MNTFFFGTKKLYGVYHAANPACDKDSGIVLCNPIGLEYMRCYWAIRQLGIRLSRDGHHVLRFDYSHTGNSAGECHQTDAEGWVEDILTALQELEDIAAPRHLSLAGLRIGGLLAAKAAETREVKNIILWEPVFSGQDYLRLLHSLNVHEHQNKRFYRARNIEPDADDLLGFSYPKILRESLGQEFLFEKKIKAWKAVIIATEECIKLNEAVVSLERSGINVASIAAMEPGDWNNPDMLDNFLILDQTFDIISSNIL